MKHAVLITGGSRGIGAAAVRAFVAEGYPVAFLYRSSVDAAQALSQETGALAICADVGNKEQLDKAVSRVQQRLGFIGTLINGAAISGSTLFQDIGADEWQQMLSTNLSGAFYAAQAVVPQMIRRKMGVILNISSIWGMVGAACEVHYSTTKAALIGMTKALAKELGPSGILVNCVAPGAIDTDMNAHLSTDDRQALMDETPLGRLGTPEEIAELLTFLASDKAGFLTGQVISPNGGIVI
ncbi:3-oxoacyl-ACP reductase FabG [Eubacteriales bacterium OttesenSCG-928-N13]|nr:3-oxoacyl-ACP reductase FabG [Eubacteriales bacterium OttesenSCG-928-N13]